MAWPRSSSLLSSFCSLSHVIQTIQSYSPWTPHVPTHHRTFEHVVSSAWNALSSPLCLVSSSYSSELNLSITFTGKPSRTVRATVVGTHRSLCFSAEAHRKVSIPYLWDHSRLSNCPWTSRNVRKTTESPASAWYLVRARHSVNYNWKDKQIYLFIPTSI